MHFACVARAYARCVCGKSVHFARVDIFSCVTGRILA